GGRYLEAMAKARTSTAVHQLLELQPTVARVKRNGKESVVPATGVAVGETVRVLPGERIPLDGTITAGSTRVDESLLTGESIPGSKTVGEPVFAATVNAEGAIDVLVTAATSDTVHASIVRLMEAAQRSRSPLQQSVDRISAVFIPIVVGIAGLTFVGWYLVGGFDAALLHGLTVLVVSCPCALGIGTPLAGAIALGRAAEEGALIRSTGVLERLAGVSQVVFDKTGTLTRGDLTVAGSTIVANGELRFLSILASVEKDSNHLAGKAIVQRVRELGGEVFETRSVSVLPGLGIEGEVSVDGEWVRVVAGSRRLMEEQGIGSIPHPEVPSADDGLSEGTAVYAAWNGKLQGVVWLSDQPRTNAREVVSRLRELGIEVSLLSGDRHSVTLSLARALGIPTATGELLPADKVRRIEEWKHNGTTLMVGDGINDAPSLAAADVSITLGSASDIAIESADVTIVGDHLDKIPWLIDFSRRTLSTIRWNLLWAFGYNGIGIALAVTGVLEPVIAALAMVVSSLFIILHSRRLGKTTAKSFLPRNEQNGL
ncbi:MAG: cation-translocating P-type ATPase, partial [Bacteroidota bacterium]